MTLYELLQKLDGVTLYPLDLIDGMTVADWLNRENIDPETPIPVWNDDAQSWEV